jgi:hypothetical protein
MAFAEKARAAPRRCHPLGPLRLRAEQATRACAGGAAVPRALCGRGRRRGRRGGRRRGGGARAGGERHSLAPAPRPRWTRAGGDGLRGCPGVARALSRPSAESSDSRPSAEAAWPPGGCRCGRRGALHLRSDQRVPRRVQRPMSEAPSARAPAPPSGSGARADQGPGVCRVPRGGHGRGPPPRALPGRGRRLAPRRPPGASARHPPARALTRARAAPPRVQGPRRRGTPARPRPALPAPTPPLPLGGECKVTKGLYRDAGRAAGPGPRPLQDQVRDARDAGAPSPAARAPQARTPLACRC